jgi:hypothetical protein
VPKAQGAIELQGELRHVLMALSITIMPCPAKKSFISSIFAFSSSGDSVSSHPLGTDSISAEITGLVSATPVEAGWIVATPARHI